MRKQGYKALIPWVLSLIRREIEQYFKEHPEELEYVKNLESLYYIKISSSEEGKEEQKSKQQKQKK